MQKEKILVVDDDLNICELLRLYLTKEGYNVVNIGVLSSQEDFINAAIETNADMILVSSLYGHGEIDCQGMREKCVDWGTIQRLGLREVIEIYISGLSDADRASETLQVLLKDRPKDPLLLLQEINICRINSDVDKLAKISRMEGLDKTVELDIHRAAAEVLWDKGERELAVEAYDAILQDVPNDRDALNAKEQYYRDSGRYDELCEFYIERAEAALAEEKTEQAVASYRKAADVAETLLFDNEKAIELLKHIVELDASVRSLPCMKPLVMMPALQPPWKRCWH